VVDTHGYLVYFERMENTQYASMDIAVGKARAAATYRRPTRAFADVINKGGPATATLPGVFASPGGLPIMVNGNVTGGSGGRERRDWRPRRAVRQGWTGRREVGWLLGRAGGH
jgi:uncharacterized protein GlcG (DUF336 family)